MFQWHLSSFVNWLQEFDDPRDADDAVYELNGRELLGERFTIFSCLVHLYYSPFCGLLVVAPLSNLSLGWSLSTAVELHLATAVAVVTVEEVATVVEVVADAMEVEAEGEHF